MWRMKSRRLSQCNFLLFRVYHSSLTLLWCYWQYLSFLIPFYVGTADTTLYICIVLKFLDPSISFQQFTSSSFFSAGYSLSVRNSKSIEGLFHGTNLSRILYIQVVRIITNSNNMEDIQIVYAGILYGTDIRNTTTSSSPNFNTHIFIRVLLFSQKTSSLLSQNFILICV